MSRFDLSPDAVEALARQRFGEPNPRLSTRRELRFGRRGSVAVSLEKAAFFDHETGEGGRLDGAARSRADRDVIGEHERRRAVDVDADRKRAIARALWRSAKPIGATPAEIYLRRARSISAPLDGGGLRFKPDAAHWPYAARGSTGPALVGQVVDAVGDLIGAHLTFVRADGLGKAPLASPRKMIGQVGGGHVPLIPGAKTVVGEGIESALSAWEAAASTGLEGLGCVAALSVGGMATLRWPTATNAILIAPDNDGSGAGERAAQALAWRASAAGLRVDFIRPPAAFNDWNDAARVRAVSS